MLPRVHRLTEKTDFENVRQNGKFISKPLFSLSFLNRKDVSPSRFGFIVSKKVSMKANVRNRIKRTFREAIKTNLESIKTGYDFIVIAKSGIVYEKFDRIQQELTDVIKNL